MVAIAAIAVPTAVRAAVTDVVTGCEFTPYLPFVLASAILLRWSQAVVAALGSVAILGVLFFGHQSTALSMPCFASSAAMFLGASAMMIGVAELFRRWISALQNREPEGGGIIFSRNLRKADGESRLETQVARVVKSTVPIDVRNRKRARFLGADAEVASKAHRPCKRCWCRPHA